MQQIHGTQGRSASWRRGLVTLTAVGLLALPATGTALAQDKAASASPAAARLAESAAGTWSVIATGDDGNVIKTVMQLTSDGKATNDAGATGTWKTTGAATFSFHLTESIHQGGNLVTRIEIDQDVTLSGTSFSGSGAAQTYDGAGALVATNQVTTKADRVSR
ncbi:hypothetical protein AB0B50_20950 [Streptomyces sp. NPDC041068]|uniref:hypothetical protein n=1 Tax=Streptomyces sp. NPDC041068 TaxID=3155130 RepID=UPI00340C806B